MRLILKTRLLCILLFAASGGITAAQPAPNPPVNYPEAARLLIAARENAAGVADLQARRNLLFMILDAQERADDWNGMGATFAAIDAIPPANPNEYESLHPALERARWLSHQNRAEESKALLRQVSERAASLKTEGAKEPGASLAADSTEAATAALMQVVTEQIKLRYFADAIVTARRFAKSDRMAQELYFILCAQAQAGDKADALRTADITGDPLNRMQALLILAKIQADKGQFREAAANRQEALRYAAALPEGKPRRAALGMLLSEFHWSDNVPGLLQIVAASTESIQRDEARECAADILWKRAKTETALARAAQVGTLFANIKDPVKRLNTACLAVMLRVWGGDSAGAKALAARTITVDNPALLLVVGSRLRQLKNPVATRRLVEEGKPTAWREKEQIGIRMRNSNDFSAALLGGASRRDALDIADSLPTDEDKVSVYASIEKNAAAAKDADTLKALRNRVEPLIAKEAGAWRRDVYYRQFAEVYAASGETARVIALAEKIPDPYFRVAALAAWGKWQTETDPKAARKTLLGAAQIAAQIPLTPGPYHAQIEIIRALIAAGAREDAAVLMAQLVAEGKAAPDDNQAQPNPYDLALWRAKIGEVNGALQAALKIEYEQQKADALTTIAESVNRSGRIAALAPILAALKDETARRNLLIRLVWQAKGDWNAAREQSYFALALDDADKANILLAIAQKQSRSNDRLAARLTLKELTPLLARMPLGIAQTQTLRNAAKLLHTAGREIEAQTLLASAAQAIVRVMKPGKQEGWHLPPTEPYTGTRLSAENEWEVQLLDIAEAQSETGHLEAALQTIRPLHVAQLRQFAVYENVRDWLTNGAPSHDLTLLTKATLPAERSYALLTAANVLLPPVNYGL